MKHPESALGTPTTDHQEWDDISIFTGTMTVTSAEAEVCPNDRLAGLIELKLELLRRDFYRHFGLEQVS